MSDDPPNLAADRRWASLLYDFASGAAEIVGFEPDVHVVVDLFDDAAKLTQIIVSNCQYPSRSFEIAAKREHRKERAQAFLPARPPKQLNVLRKARAAVPYRRTVERR